MGILFALLLLIGALSSAFATLASIIHFQILGALGFFFLTLILVFIALLIIDIQG